MPGAVQANKAPQWYAMVGQPHAPDLGADSVAQPRLFSKAETVTTRVMSSTTAPNRIVFTQTQRYKNRFMDKVLYFGVDRMQPR